MLALTHIPSPNIDHGQRTHVARQPIDYSLALQQHANYCRMLADCGAEVHTLDVNRDAPDSTFVEDTAVVLDEVAVLASMGIEARRDEPAGIEPELKKYRDVYRIEPPATLEGGDVLLVGRTVLVGMSSRTNAAGVNALERIVQRFNYRVLAIPVVRCLHLKTACTALPDTSLLVNLNWIQMPRGAGFELVPMHEREAWAANALLVGSTVCISADHVHAKELLLSRGFFVRTVQLSEFAKAEGGVTCLSLLLR